MGTSILFVAREFTDGGAAYLALRHLRHLAHSHSVDFVVTGATHPGLVQQLPKAVSFAALQIPQQAILHGLQACRESLVRLAPPCLQKIYDAVVGTSLFPDMAASTLFALSRGQRKVLVLLDEGLLVPGLRPDVRAAMTGAIHASDHLAPVSQALLTRLALDYPALGTIPFTVVLPPIDPVDETSCSPLRSSRTDGLPRVVTAARLVPDKGIFESLRVHHTLRHEGYDFHWHLIGEGPARARLEAEIRALKMDDRFHLEGFRPDARAFMRDADLCVLFSRSEGCPTVIREALAEGTPVLSTEVNGARDLIESGRDGLVVAQSEHEMQAGLRALVGNPSALSRLTENLGQRVHPPAHADTARLAGLLVGDARVRPPPDVTILIPTFNHAAVIETAIRSALMQDYPALEVVVLDDASADQTAELAHRWESDPRLRVRRRAHNLGRVGNYRRGLEEEARGEWVLVLDGDDYLTDPSFITKALTALRANAREEPVFVQAGHRVLYRKDTDTPDWALPHADILPPFAEETRLMNGAQYLEFVYATGFFTHLGTLYSRAAALASGFYTRDISSSDMDSLLRLALGRRVLVMNSIAGCWVQHGENASHNLPLANISENVRLFREIARAGAGRGILDMDRIETSLTRYEARTLAHLFQSTVGKSAFGITDGLRMIWIALRVNPKVFRDPHLRRVGLRTFRSLLKRTLRRLLGLKRGLSGEIS